MATKINETIDKLISHEISKNEALEIIENLFKSYTGKGDVHAEVQSIGFTSESNHGFLKLLVPYGYSEIKHIKKGDKVCVTYLPF